MGESVSAGAGLDANRQWRAAGRLASPEGWQPGDPFTLKTTLGRAIFNEALPADFPFVNEQVDKRVLGLTVNRLAEVYPKVEVANTLDQLKTLGFTWATRSGLTIAISDVVTPAGKAEVLTAAEGKADKVQTQYERGSDHRLRASSGNDRDLDARNG
jgi:DNA-directed RNA polymerase subunit beta'